MKTKIIPFIILFILLSCTEKQKPQVVERETSTTMDYSKSFDDKGKIKSLYQKISSKGDEKAYEELKNIYFLSGHRLDFLNVSVLMANRYKYEIAYYDIFTCLYGLNSRDDETENWIFDKTTDDTTLKYAIDNLKKADDLGNEDAKAIIAIYKKQNRYPLLIKGE